jgi:hypothetical protein
MGHRRAFVVVVAALLVMVTGVAAAQEQPAEPSEPTLTVQPRSGPVGTVFDVSGTGCLPPNDSEVPAETVVSVAILNEAGFQVAPTPGEVLGAIVAVAPDGTWSWQTDSTSWAVIPYYPGPPSSLGPTDPDGPPWPGTYQVWATCYLDTRPAQLELLFNYFSFPFPADQTVTLTGTVPSSEASSTTAAADGTTARVPSTRPQTPAVAPAGATPRYTG